MNQQMDNENRGNELERLLLHAVEAERAGVFERTAVDAVSLVGDSPRSRGWLGIARVATPIAACVGLWFGVSEMGIWSPEAAGPMTHAAVNMNAALIGQDADCVNLAVLNSCITGPGGGDLSGDCVCADLDNDGDVDFADFGRFQTTVAPHRG